MELTYRKIFPREKIMDKCEKCNHNAHYRLARHQWCACCNSCGQRTEWYNNKVGAWVEWNQNQRNIPLQKRMITSIATGALHDVSYDITSCPIKSL